MNSVVSPSRVNNTVAGITLIQLGINHRYVGSIGITQMRAPISRLTIYAPEN